MPPICTRKPIQPPRPVVSSCASADRSRSLEAQSLDRQVAAAGPRHPSRDADVTRTVGALQPERRHLQGRIRERDRRRVQQSPGVRRQADTRASRWRAPGSRCPATRGPAPAISTMPPSSPCRLQWSESAGPASDSFTSRTKRSCRLIESRVAVERQLRPRPAGPAARHRQGVGADVLEHEAAQRSLAASPRANRGCPPPAPSPAARR